MNKLDNIVKEILSRYTYFTLPDEDEISHSDFYKGKEIRTEGDHALVIRDFICLVCYANTYATPDYIAVDGNNDNITKREFLSRDHMFSEDKFGNGMDKFPTCNISSPKFKLEGKGMAVAIFKKETLDLVQTYFFAGSSLSSLYAVENDSLVFVSFNHIYIQLYGEYKADFHMTINGTGVCFGDYLVVYPPEYYDYTTSLSLIDLKKEKEYILSEILKGLHVDSIEVGSVNFDIKSQILVFKDGGQKEYKLQLSDIKKRCKAEELSKEEDYLLPGSIITEII